MLAYKVIPTETYCDGRSNGLQIEHDFHVDQALPEFSVDSAEEVERHRQLEDKLIDHDEVTNRHCT